MCLFPALVSVLGVQMLPFLMMPVLILAPGLLGLGAAPPSPPDDSGGGPDEPPPEPLGGPPLPDAEPSRTRRRGHDRPGSGPPPRRAVHPAPRSTRTAPRG